ncbi:DUF2779 domain-containing protein, partial [candidate division KSB1 bacterium]
MSQSYLSKSKYLRGWQCHKSLYLDKQHPELRDEISEGQEAVFAKGHQVGYYAQQLFPGGVVVGMGDFKNIRASVALTQELIHQNTPVIYESAFEFDGNINYMDILVKSENGWKAYEVKGSTQLKEYYLQDIAFQFYVITHSGLELEDIYLVHINNEYIRQGELDIQKLFTIISVKDQVIAMQDEIRDRINKLKQMLSQSIPAIDIGPYCEDPYPCDFYGHCWKHIPEYSVFDIGNLWTSKKFDLYYKGIVELKDIPEDTPLNDNQWMQVECEINGESIIDKAKLREFKKQFQYPLYFLDFETFQPAIPLYDNSKPYQQI